MHAFRDSEDDIEVLPVVVVMQDFPARPSSVPVIRDFVRKQLAQTPLSADEIRTLGQRVADVLLDAAGTGGTIQVSLRIFANGAEIDVLQGNQGIAAGNTVAVTSPPPDGGSAGPKPVSETSSGAGDGPSDGTDVPFAEWLADALRREGMTMEAAARQLKVSVKTVSRWVGGVTEPRLRDLARIREIFGDMPFP